MGYGSFRAAWRTLQGIEALYLLGKGRVRRVPKGDIAAQVRLLHKVLGLIT